jgi:hypothetical protein
MSEMQVYKWHWDKERKAKKLDIEEEKFQEHRMMAFQMQALAWFAHSCV